VPFNIYSTGIKEMPLKNRKIAAAPAVKGENLMKIVILRKIPGSPPAGKGEEGISTGKKQKGGKRGI